MNNKSIWKNPVFSVSAAIIFALVLLGAIMPGRFGAVSSRLFEFTTRDFGWFYLLGVFAIILFLIWLAISKYGAIRLGGEKEKPEFPFSPGSACCFRPVLASDWCFGESPSR